MYYSLKNPISAAYALFREELKSSCQIFFCLNCITKGLQTASVAPSHFIGFFRLPFFCFQSIYQRKQIALQEIEARATEGQIQKSNLFFSVASLQPAPCSRSPLFSHLSPLLRAQGTLQVLLFRRPSKKRLAIEPRMLLYPLSLLLLPAD